MGISEWTRSGLAALMAGLFAFAIASSPAHADPELASLPARAARGAELYQRSCAICHGPEGRGDGALARRLDPRPRDLTEAQYRLRSTPSGELPTSADLLRTLRRGIPGTAMPSWAGLPTDDLLALVDHLRTLSPRFAEEPPVAPLAIPTMPATSSTSLARGELLYATMECAKCHGDDGRGLGPSAFDLVDSGGRRITPFDLSRSWKLKNGGRRADLFRTLRTGLDGTPMPSYADSMSEEETWALVDFLGTLFLDQQP